MAEPDIVVSSASTDPVLEEKHEAQYLVVDSNDSNFLIGQTLVGGSAISIRRGSSVTVIGDGGDFFSLTSDDSIMPELFATRKEPRIEKFLPLLYQPDRRPVISATRNVDKTDKPCPAVSELITVDAITSTLELECLATAQLAFDALKHRALAVETPQN